MSNSSSKNPTPNHAASLFAQAVALHQQGRVQEALTCYGSLLKAEPKNIPARYYQGLLRLQTGGLAPGIADLKQVVQRQPGHAEAHYNLGLAYGELGNLVQALNHFKYALALQPGMIEACFYTGMTLARLGRPAEALPFLERVKQIKPGMAEVHHNLGNTLTELGRNEEAVAAFSKAFELRPDFAEACAGLGNVLRKLERHEEACRQYQQAIALKPDFAEAYGSLGEALREAGQHAAARDCFGKLLEMRPRDTGAMMLLGVQLTILGQPREALDYFNQALRLKPDDAELYLNTGMAYRELGEYDQAMPAYDRALQLRPGCSRSHYGRALILLARGRFETGWKEYEDGLLMPGGRLPCNRKYPRWRGEPLENRTILLCAEQGLGDEIMFASILPEIIKEAGHCVVECDTKLMRLYARSFPTVALAARRSKSGESGSLDADQEFDFQSPIGSLPMYRRNRLEAFPKHAGYLRADPERIAYWKNRLDDLGPGLKIGISWQGGVLKTGMNRRSVPLADWLPVLRQAGTRFVSLQYTDCSSEIAALEQAHGVRVAYWQEAIDDYDETAALVCALDLVITVQTSVFHLSGALGHPVWGLIPIPAEWRYMAEGQSLPWYPSARLFRQVAPGDWAVVMDAVADELSRLASDRAMSK